RSRRDRRRARAPLLAAHERMRGRGAARRRSTSHRGDDVRRVRRGELMELVRVPLARWSATRRLKNGAIVVAVRVALASVRPIPRRVLVAMGRVVGLLAWMLAGGARRIARKNVDRVY